MGIIKLWTFDLIILKIITIYIARKLFVRRKSFDEICRDAEDTWEKLRHGEKKLHTAINLLNALGNGIK